MSERTDIYEPMFPLHFRAYVEGDAEAADARTAIQSPPRPGCGPNEAAPHLRRDERGAAVIEMAFALPALIMMMWMIVQLGLVFRAMSGIQHALGEGARFATLFPQPDKRRRSSDKIEAAVYGIGPGTFTIADPVAGIQDGTDYPGPEVSYTQATDLLFLPGPTITVSRSKRVWVADRRRRSADSKARAPSARGGEEGGDRLLDLVGLKPLGEMAVLQLHPFEDFLRILAAQQRLGLA